MTLGSDIYYYAKSAREELAPHLTSEQRKMADMQVEHYRENKNRLGAFYEDSEPVTKVSIEQLREAAGRDDPHALFSLAYRLETGQGITRSLAAAMQLYKQVVLEGGANLYASLAGEYENGTGRPKDSKLALVWYRAAAEAGSARAQYRLGKAYEAGDGLDMHPVEAFKWFTLAGDRLPDATAKAELLKTGLSDKQIAEALTSAAELRSSFAR